MKIDSFIHILVLVIAVCAFSMPFVNVTGQQNTELHEIVTAAEKDAKATINQVQWWFFGFALFGVPASGITTLPSPAKLVGKSPEYIEVYTKAYQKRAVNLKRSAAIPGCLTMVFSVGIIAIFLSELD